MHMCACACVFVCIFISSSARALARPPARPFTRPPTYPSARPSIRPHARQSRGCRTNQSAVGCTRVVSGPRTSEFPRVVRPVRRRRRHDSPPPPARRSTKPGSRSPATGSAVPQYADRSTRRRRSTGRAASGTLPALNTTFRYIIELDLTGVASLARPAPETQSLPSR